MVFLRPVILRDGQASANLANERYDYLRARQGEFSLPHNFMLPDLPVAQLPALPAQPPAKPVDAAPVATPASPVAP